MSLGSGRADGVDSDGRRFNPPSVFIPVTSGKPLRLGTHLWCYCGCEVVGWGYGDFTRSGVTAATPHLDM